ncbi:hypothetical protein N866_08475 [Actinotalea ferrariae CF5-4]|uniref:Uncharacterized protein n=1 Tax=Actinotalea ferrariae CF5-4 TaxID=948458 RepID=A0A021VMQ8_9CELL|nr:hypothetical protein [Actinotalea ferrariae]EYR62446.1 hypothetical protein N866_08475 [Actinotalea ferrariae CF5-4]
MTTFATETEAYSPIRLREGEFEKLVPRFVERLSDRWIWADWKPLLDGPAGRVRPDVALVAKDCSRWCVVEVELASHPESHFRDQFEALEAAYYGTHLLPGLAAAFPSLVEGDIERLLREVPPTLLCIADDLSEALRVACRDFGFELAVGTPYRSTSGSYAIEWRRLPSALANVQPTSGVEYLLRLAPERFGGRQRATLPREFPNIKHFTLRVAETMHPMRVFDLSASRATYLPTGTVQAQGRPLLVRPIDPINGLYELLNGEVLG